MNFKNLIRLCFLSAFIIFHLVGAAKADLISVVYDNYVGASSSNSATRSDDVIGDDTFGDIERAELHRFPAGCCFGQYRLLIYSKAPHSFPERLNQIFGGLFLSTDGYRPYDQSPHVDDNHFNGEDWEYVVLTGGNVTSIFVSLTSPSYQDFSRYYPVVDDNIIYTSSAGGENYRAGQEWWYDSTGLGQPTIIIPPDAPQAAYSPYRWMSTSISFRDGYYIFSTTLSDVVVAEAMANGGNLRFHFTTKNGSDVIEGSFAVPEPSSLLLLLGASVVGFRRSRRKKISAVERC